MEDNKPTSVQTVLTISNTDIVTMLMVQQKKVLQDKLPELKAIMNGIEYTYQVMVEEVINKRIAENGAIVALRQAVETITKIYNPNTPFRVDFSNTVAIEAQNVISRIFSRGYHGSSINSNGKANPEIIVESLPNLAIFVGNLGASEEEVNRLEDDFHFVSEENEFEVPHRHKDIIAIKKDDAELWQETADQMARINQLLRDDTKMKEEIVAKMTEKAINSNIELQAIVGDILLLE